MTALRAVVQRVNRAAVTVDGRRVAGIGRGILVLLGVAAGDDRDDAAYLAEKVAYLRIFNDSEGKMNLSALDVRGEALVVSQFTLLGDCRRGRRPSFTDAAAAAAGDELYQRFCELLAGHGVPVSTGTFGAHMVVELENDGPVTLLLDSKKAF